MHSDPNNNIFIVKYSEIRYSGTSYSIKYLKKTIREIKVHANTFHGRSKSSSVISDSP